MTACRVSGMTVDSRPMTGAGQAAAARRAAAEARAHGVPGTGDAHQKFKFL
jgi:hypothetical protein